MSSILKTKEFWKNTDQHIVYFYNYCEKIKNIANKEEAKILLDDMYQYLKDVTSEYLEGDSLNYRYNYLKQLLLICEQSLPLDFIIESSPKFEFKSSKLFLDENMSTSEKLDWIVYMTRLYLINKFKYEDINAESLANTCDVASKKVASLCKTVGLTSKRLIIYPGFKKSAKLYDGSGYHLINLVKDGDEKYIVDCTYRQFFTNTHNNINRLGIVGVSGCRAGVFMTMDPDRKELATNILKKGWFLATDENIKNYLDGFALSYRNGLYYLSTNDYSYTTNYTAEDYMSFLKGEDSQVAHEPLETLGFQRTLKPTKK